LHGAAADALVALGCGPAGLSAGETIDAARRIVSDTMRNSGQRSLFDRDPTR
jgi:hypothetical protein